ncbi:MAG: site-specific integrase [Cyclobacteriaceae bacterium]
MKRRTSFNVLFWINRSRIKDGKASINARITVNQQKANFSVKRSIPVELWDQSYNRAKGSSGISKDINLYLDIVKTKLFDAYQELLLHDAELTAETIKNKYLGIEEDQQTLIGLCDYHNEEMRDVLEWGTLKNYFTTRKYILIFLKTKMKVSDLSLGKLSFKFLTDFESFLRRYEPSDHQKPMGQNTIMKHIERFRKMVNLAIRNEWIKEDPFVKFQAKFQKVERGYLTRDELTMIEKREFRIERLDQVRDLFVFSCYTGLSYAEVYDLSPCHLIKGMDGDYWIEGQRKKTKESYSVPLLPQAMRIIDKYRGTIKGQVTGKLLPVLSNQKLNSYLKEIADLTGIEKNITFHLARHTFATTITLANGVSLETVGKMLGHASLRSTQVYAKVIKSKISDEMGSLRSKMAEKQMEVNRDTA